MNCAEIKEQLGAVLDAALAPELEKAIMLHVSTCSSCQDEWDRAQALRSVLRASPQPVPSASLDARVMEVYYQSRAPRREARGWWQRLAFGSISIPKPAFALILIAVASALAVAIQIGRVMATPIIVTMSAPSPIEGTTAAPPPQIVYVPVEQVRKARDVSTGLSKRTSVARMLRSVNAAGQTSTRPLKNSMVISSIGTSYATEATLKDFEPITNATVRVIKGKGE